MNINKSITFVAMLAAAVFCGCASHRNTNNIEYYNPGQGVHSVDRSRVTSSDSMGIYSKGTQTNFVVTTNADGSWYADYSSHTDRGFHLPFGGGGNKNDSGCSTCGGQTSVSYANQPSPFSPPPMMGTGPQVYPYPYPQTYQSQVIPQAPPRMPQVFYPLYGIPPEYYCLPQMRIRYYPPHPWWKHCRR